MRYVIGICLLTAFIIWDGWANEGHYLDVAARQTIWLLRAIGVGH